MRYVENNLIPGEKVVYSAQLHWIIFFGPIVSIPFILGIPWLIATILQKKTTEMAVTNKRVIIKAGIISRQKLDEVIGKIVFILKT